MGVGGISWRVVEGPRVKVMGHELEVTCMALRDSVYYHNCYSMGGLLAGIWCTWRGCVLVIRGICRGGACKHSEEIVGSSHTKIEQLTSKLSGGTFLQMPKSWQILQNLHTGG